MVFTYLGTNWAVVRTLRTVGHATFGPSQRSTLVEIEEREFLFEAEPDFLIFVATKGLHGLGTIVGRQGFSLGSVAITHDKNIVESIRSDTERILKDTARLQDDFGVVTRGLTGRRAIKVPLGKRFDTLSLFLINKEWQIDSLDGRRTTTTNENTQPFYRHRRILRVVEWTCSLTFLAGKVRVLERVLPTASTQTYSAKIVSAGKGKSL